MIYLKTIFSAPNEVKYIKLNLRESWGVVDRVIISEFNRTHTGEARDFTFKNYWNEFTLEEQQKIIYIAGDIAKQTVNGSESSALAHKNEQLMRGYFAHQIDLNDTDIVCSVDADEIIFRRQYEKILNTLSWWRPAVKLQLHQFFYRINYLWENNKFIAPTVCKAKYYKRKYPGQWRYDGKLFPEIAGAHFSWCLTIDEMIDKLHRYAHREEYGHLADRKILEEAIAQKTYPFDPKVDFRIRVLDPLKDKEFYPEMIYEMMGEFKSLLN